MQEIVSVQNLRGCVAAALPFTAAPCTEEDKEYVRRQLNAIKFALVPPPAGAEKK